MTVTIDLSPDLERQLQERAVRTGLDLQTIVLEAVREKMARPRTFDEVVAPFSRAVEASGISDDDFAQFFEEVREEIWQEKHAASGKAK